MTWSEVGNTACPIARALAVVGDRWTVLILRELFLGTRRFDAFQAQTGMSSHLLSTRLKRLEEDGVIARCAYSERPLRHEYQLTEKGLDLYPLLLSLKAWGERWESTSTTEEPALTIVHRNCNHRIGLDVICTSCGERVEAKTARFSLGAKFAAERRARGGQ